MKSEINLTESVFNYPIVAFDTETSGPYALESEIIELGAVKWLNGQVIDKFQTLLKPKQLLHEDNIKIHGITNEMVSNAPNMKELLPKFLEFIKDSVLVAHHAPFDIGFLVAAIEEHLNSAKLPTNIILCSSLISRVLLPSPNHKLQTLIKEYKLNGGSAHRAYDDALACLEVLNKSILKLNLEDQNLENLLRIQNKKIVWSNYTIFSSCDEKLKAIGQACLDHKIVDIVYSGGQTREKTRAISPKGIVRNPDGDYVHAVCEIDKQRKRFYLDKITDYQVRY